MEDAGRGVAAAPSASRGRLRIALSTARPPGVARACRAAEQRRGRRGDRPALLRSLGHEVIERRSTSADRDRAATSLARYLRGIHDDAAAMPHPERLEPRTSELARLGRRGRPVGPAPRVGGASRPTRARVNAIFDDVDVVLSPSPRRRCRAASGVDRRRAAPATLLAPLRASCRSTPLWNRDSANPAMTSPAGLTRPACRCPVQIVARPREEETLLSLAAQVERARPWADRRPPASGA